MGNATLIEIPEGWENGGDFSVRFDGAKLRVGFGEVETPAVVVEFDWVRSFRYVSEATYDSERDGLSADEGLLSERGLPHALNPSRDYYGFDESIGKGPPRLFRMFHYKAGFLEIVASDWCQK